MWKVVKIGFLLGIVALTSTSCEFRKIEKSQDWRVKHEAGLKYYEEEEYYKAGVLFEQILPIVRGLPEGEEVQFLLAYCNYYQGLNVLAAHYFKTFYESYGRSSKVEEARYMNAYALYIDAPNSNLDQTSTMLAQEAMQNFINRYPGSEYRADANDILNEMQYRLEQKGFNNAFQYYKLKMWSASVVAFQNFEYEFPDSKLIEQSQFYSILAEFQYAEQSISTKQQERYREVKAMYEKFIDQYPDSELIKQVEKAYEKALDKLQKIAIN